VGDIFSQEHKKASFILNKGAVCLKPITTAQIGATKHDTTARIFTTEDLRHK
jgi:hypothetical protein